MADIANFIDQHNDRYPDVRHQWVVIGGSYPGALVAWFKSKYPRHAAAAWSSSGVIHAIQDYAMFDTDIWQSAALSSDDCPQKIKKINQMVDDIFDNGT